MIKDDFESCVLCGKNTYVPKDRLTDLRDRYIEGVGQLCIECHCNLYKRKRSNDFDTDTVFCFSKEQKT